MGTDLWLPGDGAGRDLWVRCGPRAGEDTPREKYIVSSRTTVVNRRAHLLWSARDFSDNCQTAAR